MKSLGLVLALVVLAVPALVRAQTEQVTLTYERCESCPPVADVLSAVNGVLNTTVTGFLRRAVVSYDRSNTTTSLLLQALQAAGYRASLLPSEGGSGDNDAAEGAALAAGGVAATAVGVAGVATGACLSGVCAIGAGAAVVGGAGATIGAFFASPVVATVLIVGGVALLAYGGYKIYRGLTEPSTCALPQAQPAPPESTWRRYMKFW